MSQCVLQFTRPTFRNSLRPSKMQGAVRSIAQLADLNSLKKAFIIGHTEYGVVVRIRVKSNSTSDKGVEYLDIPAFQSGL